MIEANALSLHLYEGPEWIIESTGSVISGSHRIDEGSIDVYVSDLSTTSTDVESNAEREGYRNYEVGGVNDGYQFAISFDVPSDWPEADQRIEEILASIQWR